MKLSEKAQSAFDTVVRKFETGDLTEMVQARAILPEPGAPCLTWSFMNRALLSVQKQTKGTPAAYIFAPYLKAKGEDERDERGNKRYDLKGWTTVPVFAVQDTEPIDPEVPSTVDYAPREMPPLFEVATRLGLSVEFAPHGGRLNGFYKAGSQEIVLGVTTHRTFWHELAHAAHHHADVVDFLPNDQSAAAKAYREAVAEMTAAVLGEMYGEPCAGTSYAYLTKYYEDPLVGITKALAMVGKVLDLITTLAESPASVAA